MKIKLLACALALGVLAVDAAAQPASPQPTLDVATLDEAQIRGVQVPAVLNRLVHEYRERGDRQRLRWALERLHGLLPDSGAVGLALAEAYAAEGDRSRAYNQLLRLQKQGYGFDIANDPKFAKVADTNAWTYIAESLANNLKPFGEGKVAFSLPAGDQLFQALAWDRERGQFLVGSVREGRIYRMKEGGKPEPFIRADKDNGLWGVYAMAVVPEEDALWVASSASPYFRDVQMADLGKAGVFRFSLATGKFVARYLLEPERQSRMITTLAAGANGRVYAADGVHGVVYKLDGDKLGMMVANPLLTEIRAMALNGNGSTLYFADYAMGILGVELAAGKGFGLQYDHDQLVLGGIDGLLWYDGMLVAIEGGMSPPRVMRMRLSADGRGVTQAMALDAAQPAFSFLGQGTVRGDGLYFIANSQLDRYDDTGTPVKGASFEPVNVFRSDLRFAWDAEGKQMGSASQARKASAGQGAPGTAGATSESTPGEGVFSNVRGGSETVPAR